jgi:HK97 family phage major capsid protein
MPSNTIDIVRSNFTARQEIQAGLLELDEKCTTENRSYTDDETAFITEERSKLEAIDARIQANLEMETRSQAIDSGLDKFLGVVADRDRSDITDHRSAGERAVDSDEYRSWSEAGAKGHIPHIQMNGLDFRSVTDVTTGATSGGAFIQKQRLARVGQDFQDRKTFLIDLLPVIPISGPIEYVQDKSPLADFANKAVEVAESSAKPQAGPTLEVVSENGAVIAAWVNITRQTLADAREVAAYLNGRLRYSLKRRADAQVINGDGNSPNLSGLLDRAGINTYTAPAGAEAAYVSIRKGITEMEKNEAVGEIVVLNPVDAENFDLSNSATAGIHAVPNLAVSPPPSAWGLQRVTSTAIASGTALIIDPMAVAVLDREQPTVYTTDSHGTNFTSNIVTMLLECRVGLAVFEPTGICKVTFDYVP